jgi:transcriptional regulator with XRE-family HTH domain
MRYPIYVQRLIEMARSLGVDQREIAKRLQIPDSSLSLWATGKRPIPRRHLPAFMALISELIRAHDATHRAHLNHYLEAWNIELHVHAGAVSADAQRKFEVLRSFYAQGDVLKIPREERQRLREACQDLVFDLDSLDQYEQGHLPEPFNSQEPPEARFAQFRSWFGVDEAEE